MRHRLPNCPRERTYHDGVPVDRRNEGVARPVRGACLPSRMSRSESRPAHRKLRDRTRSIRDKGIQGMKRQSSSCRPCRAIVGCKSTSPRQSTAAATRRSPRADDRCGRARVFRAARGGPFTSPPRRVVLVGGDQRKNRKPAKLGRGTDRRGVIDAAGLRRAARGRRVRLERSKLVLFGRPATGRPDRTKHGMVSRGVGSRDPPSDRRGNEPCRFGYETSATA